MLLLKKPIINIGFLRPVSFETYVDASFFLLLCSVFANNSNQSGRNYFYYFGFFLFLGLTLVKLVLRVRVVGTVILPSMTLWYALFLLLGVASSLWADNPWLCVYNLSRLMQCLIITFCMAQHYSTRNGLVRCLKLIVWTGIYSICYILFKTPFAVWFSGGLGRSATEINPNGLGMIFCICTLISFYFAYYTPQKPYYLFALIQFTMVILTSSRKSMLSAIMGIVLLVLLNMRRKHYIMRIAFIIALAFLALYLIMNVPQLYSAIGWRIESMLNFIDTNEGDNSMALRRMFIICAREIFFDNMLIGVGLNNFASRLGALINLSTYAHNNYYEILADLGLVGFVLYYSFYGVIVVKTVSALRSGSTMAHLMLTIMATIMICEYGLVSFYSVFMLIFLCTASMFVSSYYNSADMESALPDEVYGF